MSWETFDDECQDCKPAMIKLKTGPDGEPIRQADGSLVVDGIVPDNDPAMIAILDVWAKTTLKERQVYHRVCCQNSQHPTDLQVFREIGKRLRNALEK
jgi:hypothetical protein